MNVAPTMTKTEFSDLWGALFDTQDLTTFIIPSLRRETLERALDSARDQAECLVNYDDDHKGAGLTRNEIIEKVKTPWVSMLDDDDTVSHNYVERLQEEIEKHPNADAVIFREYFLHGVVLPAWPEVAFGNIPISFSVKTDVAKEFPFKQERYEDYEFIRRLQKAGKNIVFSKYLTYFMRH